MLCQASKVTVISFDGQVSCNVPVSESWVSRFYLASDVVFIKECMIALVGLIASTNRSTTLHIHRTTVSWDIIHSASVSCGDMHLLPPFTVHIHRWLSGLCWKSPPPGASS